MKHMKIADLMPGDKFKFKFLNSENVYTVSKVIEGSAMVNVFCDDGNRFSFWAFDTVAECIELIEMV